MWLFALFVAVPLIEIALFIQIGGLIGLWPTLLIVVLTAILGTTLVRSQGLGALENLRNSFSELGDPTEPLAHGAMILFSGALLLTPGFFTDAVGFALLVPGVRSAVFRYFRSRVEVQQFSYGSERSAQGSTIEGEFEEVEEVPPRPRKGPSRWTEENNGR
ncbi:MAG: FxsA family protein [Dinoroseobacter sp.]|nr:FxsA family protein [Dinoroseobacter sp.]MDJ0995206.1 FxsA family protein [Dinoroseobacter sp.]